MSRSSPSRLLDENVSSCWCSMCFYIEPVTRTLNCSLSPILPPPSLCIFCTAIFRCLPFASGPFDTITSTSTVASLLPWWYPMTNFVLLVHCNRNCSIFVFVSKFINKIKINSIKLIKYDKIHVCACIPYR